MNHVSQKHISEEVAGALRWMPLHKDVQVAERRVSIPDSRIGISHVQRANELTVVDQLYLLVVPLEELGDATTKKVHPPIRKRIVPNADSTSCFKRGDELFFRVIV